jgi:hypothetical protein|tara:strand:- start:930 stop:1151 length:222 start_codon:yes stop_codon:yes gene_type:complete
MKPGDLIRFTKTGILGIVTEVYDKTHPVGERVKVFSTYEDDETGEQVQVNHWFGLDYLLRCSEPAETKEGELS